ncbi:hypothetical protein B0H14DRAFT_3482037 [Mycena olivaceomarginata]|nr:hypothetical protein B0H14DRAFT_3482037 [Mycena olivaceomarginata]
MPVLDSTSDAASSVVVASDLKHGERCVQLNSFPYLASLHWSGLGQIHGELAESYWGFTRLGRTEAELPLNTWYIPYLCMSQAPRLIDLALGIFYMTGDDEDDDEMPPLIEEEEIPDLSANASSLIVGHVIVASPAPPLPNPTDVRKCKGGSYPGRLFHWVQGRAESLIVASPRV